MCPNLQQGRVAALLLRWLDGLQRGINAGAVTTRGFRAAPLVNLVRRENLYRLPPAYGWVVAIGAVFTLARFNAKRFWCCERIKAGCRWPMRRWC